VSAPHSGLGLVWCVFCLARGDYDGEEEKLALMEASHEEGKRLAARKGKPNSKSRGKIFQG